MAYYPSYAEPFTQLLRLDVSELKTCFSETARRATQMDTKEDLFDFANTLPSEPPEDELFNLRCVTYQKVFD